MTESAEMPTFGEIYSRSRRHKLTFILVCTAICFFISVYSVTIGPYPISVSEVLDILWKAVTFQTQTDETAAHIILSLRLPRIVGGLVCGFALGICGTAMQSMMKNPLADPYTMGISSGAGFGAALAMILGVQLVAGGGVIVNAFVFAVIPALAVLFLSRFRRATPTMMILCGISLMYLFNALTQLFMLIADPDDLSAVYQWMVGSLDGMSYDAILLVFLISAVGSLYVQYMSNQLNVMGLGDESAQTLGVDVEKKRLVVLMVITLVAAAVVSFTGVIGFVGLVAPHIARTVIGADNRYLLPASGIFGSLLLVASDVVARTVASPVILPVGVITACIGGPLFMFLILRSTKESWS